MTKGIGVQRPDISALEVVSKGILQVFPAFNRVFWEVVSPVPSWSLKFEGEVFDGM